MIKREDKHMVVSGIAAAVGVSAATAAAGITAGASLIGTGASLYSQYSAMGSQEDAMAAAAQQQAASRRAEIIRKRQMEAEARYSYLRAERERRVNLGRTVAAGTASGGGAGSSWIGAEGGPMSTYATNTRQTGTALTHGRQMFEANMAYSIAGGQVAQAQGEADMALGQGKLIAGAASGFGSLATTGASLFGTIGPWTTTVKPAGS